MYLMLPFCLCCATGPPWYFLDSYVDAECKDYKVAFFSCPTDIVFILWYRCVISSIMAYVGACSKFGLATMMMYAHQFQSFDAYVLISRLSSSIPERDKKLGSLLNRLETGFHFNHVAVLSNIP